MAEKLEAQKEQRELETQRDKKPREPVTRQGEIQARRDVPIEELESPLGRRVTERTLLCFEWVLV